ncbi:MAG: beta-galactosidase [Opitutales bacterium]|nr:beta-galactosidase [Opitutales bacterium]
MKSSLLLFAVSLSAFCAGTANLSAAPKKSETPVKFEFAKNPQNPQDGIFVLNGKPFQIRGGEIHPQRIPREYWDHLIKMCKAMGLNPIAFYTMWNDF